MFRRQALDTHEMLFGQSHFAGAALPRAWLEENPKQIFLLALLLIGQNSHHCSVLAQHCSKSGQMIRRSGVTSNNSFKPSPLRGLGVNLFALGGPA